MQKEKIKVLLAEDNDNFRSMVESYLNEQDDIQVVASVEDGMKAYESIPKTNPDVVITHIIMPNLDGLGVLEKIESKNMKNKPAFMVLSGINQESIIKKAMNLGARYYITKPFDMDMLVKRVKDVYESRMDTNLNEPSKEYIVKVENKVNLQEKVTSIMHDLGVPAHTKGYHYIRDAIIMVINDLEMINSITKLLYPTIAKKYKTTSSRVERAIRHAIEISWLRGDINKMEDLFGNSIDFDRARPTNSEFLSTLADSIKIKSRNLIG